MKSELFNKRENTKKGTQQNENGIKCIIAPGQCYENEPKGERLQICIKR